MAAPPSPASCCRACPHPASGEHAAAALARVRILLVQIGEDVIAEYHVLMRGVQDAVKCGDSDGDCNRDNIRLRLITWGGGDAEACRIFVREFATALTGDDSSDINNMNMFRAFYEKVEGEDDLSKGNSTGGGRDFVEVKQELDTTTHGHAVAEICRRDAKAIVNPSDDSVRPCNSLDVAGDVGKSLGNYSLETTATTDTVDGAQAQFKRPAYGPEEQIRKRLKKKKNLSSAKISKKGTIDSIFGDDNEKKAKKEKKRKNNKKQSSRKKKDSIFDDIFGCS